MATIVPGVMLRISNKVLAQPFSFCVEQLAENIVGNMNISVDRIMKGKK